MESTTRPHTPRLVGITGNITATSSLVGITKQYHHIVGKSSMVQRERHMKRGHSNAKGNVGTYFCIKGYVYGYGKRDRLTAQR